MVILVVVGLDVAVRGASVGGRECMKDAEGEKRNKAKQEQV